jgi:hypothetical protein
MASFPRSEPEIAALALLVTQGLSQASEDFPTPPIPGEELQAKLDAYNTARAATVAADTTSREQHAIKDQALEELVDGMKANLRYAEVAVRDQPEKLNQLGWGTRRSSSSLEAPGEVRDISVRAEGDTWVVFDWKAPVDGGAVAAYTIQRRNRDGGSWEDVGTSVDVEELLSNQPRGVELDYRVIAVNKAGAGQPSATATVVL